MGKKTDIDKKTEKKEKYRFDAITIFSKVDNSNGRKHLYRNLTDHSIFSTDTSVGCFKSMNSDFVITFCNTSMEECYIAPITLSELMALAGIKESEFEKFERKFDTKDDIDEGYAKEIYAFSCAKMILDYNRGKICRVDNTDEPEFEFYRERFIKLPDGKRTRDTNPVFCKKLERVKSDSIWH